MFHILSLCLKPQAYYRFTLLEPSHIYFLYVINAIISAEGNLFIYIQPQYLQFHPFFDSWNELKRAIILATNF